VFGLGQDELPPAAANWYVCHTHTAHHTHTHTPHTQTHTHTLLCLSLDLCPGPNPMHHLTHGQGMLSIPITSLLFSLSRHMEGG